MYDIFIFGISCLYLPYVYKRRSSGVQEIYSATECTVAQKTIGKYIMCH